jgi:hypothetical protein|tara:strand:- start:162 stop:842 length:681 start_codon:yes stop_codon:yes gene_type:complete
MKPGQILATGLLFFLLLMPLFTLIGDMRVQCEFNLENDCSEYTNMQGLIGAGLLFGLMLSVGGAYKMRNLTKRTKGPTFGKYSLQDHNIKDSMWDSESKPNDISFIEQYGLDESVLVDVLKVLQNERDNAQNDSNQLLSKIELNSDSSSEIDALMQKQTNQKTRVSDIEQAMTKIKTEMKGIKESQAESNLDMKDSVISGDVMVNDPHEIAEAAIKAYKMGQQSKD